MPDLRVSHAGARATIHAAFEGVADLLLPRCCAVCERSVDAGDHGVVCGRCWARAHELPHPRCDRCGHPQWRPTCSWCDQLPPFVRAARSAYWIPGGTAASIVHALKYNGWSGVAAGMAERMARLPWPPDVIAERSMVVPTPLAATRERERGFNQSALLGRALASRWKIPFVSECVVRARVTATQTRLTPEERRGNVSGAFRATPNARERLRGAHVVLVDDVITTGATLSECATTLFESGARIISIVTFGRAPAAGDRAH
ncbi:MAG: ComF family protein [Gemmatimonadales bacterium]